MYKPALTSFKYLLSINHLMADIMTVFSLILVISLIVSFIVGIIILTKKKFTHHTRKTIGIFLLLLGIVNFILFNIFIFEQFYYEVMEFVSLILLFLIFFVEGLVLLNTKEISKGLKKFFGILLIILPFIWIIAALI